MNPTDKLYVNSNSISSNYVKQMGVDIAWESGLTGKGVKIAVIDTGYSYTADETDVIRHTVVPGDSDLRGHGTMVSNIIGAEWDNSGMAGIAPDAEIFSIKAYTDNDGFHQDDVAAAIEKAITLGVDIINMSIAGHSVEVNQDLASAINYAQTLGITIVAATGNDGVVGASSWPANFEGVHGVGAVNRDGYKSDFSEVGALDLYASGENLNLTGNGDAFSPNSAGTSFAAPMVTGAMALLIEAGKDVNEIYNYTSYVEGYTGLSSPGAGLINVGYAAHVGDNHLINLNQEVYSIGDGASLSYLIPEQDDNFHVKVTAVANGDIFSLNSSGMWVNDDIFTFSNLPSNTELNGNLFSNQQYADGSYDSIFGVIDTSSLLAGDYEIQVDLIGVIGGESLHQVALDSFQLI